MSIGVRSGTQYARFEDNAFVASKIRLVGTGQNCSLVSRNRPVSTGFYKGTLVSFLVLDVKKVRFVEVYPSDATLTPCTTVVVTELLLLR